MAFVSTNGPPRAHRPTSGTTHSGTVDSAAKSQAHSSPGATDDRLQRALAENQNLKVQRNEQDQKIKELNTKFQKLVRDFRAGRGSGAFLSEHAIFTETDVNIGLTKPGATNTTGDVAKIAAERDHALAQLHEARRTIDLLQHELAALRQTIAGHSRGGGGAHPPATHSPSRYASGAGSGHDTGDVHRLKAQSSIDQAKIEALTEERNQLRTQLQLAIAQSGGQTATASAAATNAMAKIREEQLVSENASLRSQLATATAAMDSLTKERDDYRTEANRLRNTGGGALSHQPSHQFLTVHDLTPFGELDAAAHRIQQAASEKSSQLTVLAHRLEQSQAQASMLTTECDRLLQELKNAHAVNAELKRRLFQVEAEKGSSDVRAQRATELEAALQIKQDEVVRCEQELLRMIDALQVCSRDTEVRVRADCSSRFAEMERLKDDSDRNRRNKERDNYQLTQEVSDLKRSLRSAEEEVAACRKMVIDATKAKNDLADEVARLTRMDNLASVTAVERATAKAEAELASATVGAEWNDKWETEKLRETLSQCMLERELAEARSHQLEISVNDMTATLTRVTKERDELLQENLSFRRHQSLDKRGMSRSVGRVASSSRGGSAGGFSDDSLVFAVESVKWIDDAIRSVLVGEAGSTEAVAATFVFCVDGLLEFESVVSDSFVYEAGVSGSASGFAPLSLKFTELPLMDPAYVDKLRVTTFSLQLHQVSSDFSTTVVAHGTFDLGTLVRAARQDAYVRVTLNDGERAIGAACVRLDFLPKMVCDRLLSFAGALSSNASFLSGKTAEQRTAALLALRAASGIRVQVVRCTDLAFVNGRTPQPYIFYTASFEDGRPSPSGFLSETAVRTRSNAITCNPSFDVLPKDHEFDGAIDDALLDFLDRGKVSFVVLDMASEDPTANLGIAELPLRPLLNGLNHVLQASLALHPQGTVDVVISWSLA